MVLSHRELQANSRHLTPVLEFVQCTLTETARLFSSDEVKLRSLPRLLPSAVDMCTHLTGGSTLDVLCIIRRP